MDSHRYTLRLLAAVLLLGTAQAHAGSSVDSGQNDLVHLPLEQLLEMEIVTASKFAQKISDAPSAVSIVTAEDIKAYGYRTLADILNSMRGLYTTYDRIYQYLGGRGFGRPGDYTGRIMLLIDGYIANDNLFNQSFIGTDGLLDANLIQRVEYVPGPGSAVYGNNAFFGIINVMTKQGRDFNGTRITAETGSYGTRGAGVTYGQRLANGADVLLSASGLDSDGQTLSFPEVSPEAVRSLDYENNQRLFGKMRQQELTLEGAYVRRKKGVPTAVYGADFNTPNFFQDTNAFLSARYDTDLSSQLKSSTHVYLGNYDFHQIAWYGGVTGEEHDVGKWWGIDEKFVGTWFDRHKLVFGAEYRDDYHQSFTIYPLDARHGARTASLYLQDEIVLTEKLLGNIGARYGYNSDSGGMFSPRLALMYSLTEMSTLKASYGVAYRLPNAYEKYYEVAGSQLANPGLRPEYVHTAELALEHKLSDNTRVIGSLYHSRTKDLISLVYRPDLLDYQNINVASTHTEGAELELERHWDSGTHLRGSYSWQLARDETGGHMANSPRHLGKANLTFPFLQNSFRSGLELQYLGARRTEHNTQLGGYTLANFTLSSNRLLPNLEISASIRNLFDHRYEAVAPDAPVTQLTSILQDGRNYWLQLVYSF